MIDGSLRSLIRKNLPLVHWQAIETGGTGRGIPDMNGCSNGIEVWIENKVASGLKVHTMRPEQVAWIERRARAGGRVFIFVRKDEALWLLSSGAARLLLDGVRMRDLPAKVVCGRWLSFPWPWAEIDQALFRTPLSD